MDSHRSGWRILLIVALVTALLPSRVSEAAPDKPGADVTPSQAGITIPGGPLTITVYTDGSLGLTEAGRNQFFAQRASGVFMWVDGRVYGPTVPAGNSLYSYSLIRQSALTGNGSAANPWRVTTELGVGSTGVRLLQTVSYANGARSIDFSWTITNGSTARAYTLFHAADLYVDGNDFGTGFFDDRTRAVGGVNRDSRIYGTFIPVTPASAYEEAHYSTIWSRIGNPWGSGFRNTIDSRYIDNGAGLQWNIPIQAANASRTILSRYSVTLESTASSTQEEPPLRLDSDRDRLPRLREFEFGTTVATDPVADYRSGEITFTIPISRYYGSFGSNLATDANFARLVDPVAKLTLRVFDLDPQERRQVRVNGCTLPHQPTGSHNAWREITLDVPSRCLNFPSLPSGIPDETALNTNDIPQAVRIEPANNTITVTSDLNNRGYRTMIAWARLTVGGVRPVLYLHGLDPSCSNGYTRALGSIRAFLNEDGIPNLGARNNGANSIHSQAVDLYLAYAEMQRIYGLRTHSNPGGAEPDRILLLGHSMGGLTGRRFINLQHSAGNPIVEKFVALATPNTGSLLSGIGNIGMDPNWPGLRGCNDDAMADLSTNYIRNTFNPANNLTYSWRAWERYSGSLSANQHMISIAATEAKRIHSLLVRTRSDGVVTADNTFGLNYDSDLYFDCIVGETPVDPNNPAAGLVNCGLYGDGVLHNKIVNFRALYAALKTEIGIGQVVRSADVLGRNTNPNLAATAEAPATLVQTPESMDTIFRRTGSLAAGQSTVISITIDPLSILLVHGLHRDGVLSYSLRSPSGVTTPAEDGVISLSTPETGIWELTIDAPTQTIDYVIVAEGASSLQINPNMHSTIVIGDSGQLAVEINDGGIGLSGLSVSGEAHLPGASVPIPLNFSADPANSARYVASVSPTQSGPILAIARITGQRASGQSFSREIFLSTRAIPGGVIDPFALTVSRGDNEGDGLSNVLSTTIQLNLPSAGDYRVSAVLQRVNDGQAVAASEQLVSAAAGPLPVTLSFDGSYLGTLGLNESVRLAQVGVTRETGELLDIRATVGASFNLNSNTFQRPRLQASVISGQPVDLNNDGRFDEIAFVIDITTEVAGSYTVIGTLSDSAGQPFSFSERGFELNRGRQTIRIAFRGRDVFINGQSGVFTLANLVIIPQTSSLDPLRLENAFTTAALNSASFSGAARLSLTSNAPANKAFIRVSPASPDGVYDEGQQVTLEPVILADLIFYGWRVDGQIMTSPTLTITLNSDRTVEAIFIWRTLVPLIGR